MDRRATVHTWPLTLKNILSCHAAGSMILYSLYNWINPVWQNIDIIAVWNHMDFPKKCRS